MFHKLQPATPNAAHAMRPMENKESTPRESDTSASMETSVLLKILNSTNSPELKKLQEVLPTKNPNASSTTKVQKISEISVLNS